MYTQLFNKQVPNKQYCQNTIEHSLDAYHAVTTAIMPQYNCHPTHSTIMDKWIMHNISKRLRFNT